SSKMGSSTLLWDPATGKAKRRICGKSQPVAHGHIAFSPTGEAVVVAGQDGLEYWNVGLKDVLRVMPHVRMDVLAFSPNGKIIASAGGGERIELWDVGYWDNCFEAQGHQEPITSLVITPDNKAVFTASFVGRPRLWELA